MTNKKGMIPSTLLLLMAIGAGTADTRTLHVIAGETKTDYHINFWEKQQLGSPSMDNYDFAGWKDDAGHDVSGNTVEYMLEEKTVEATWSPRIYTVNYYDGDTLLCSRGHLYGYSSPVQNLQTNFRNHPKEVFAGWADADGNTVSEIPADLSADISLFALYEGREYKLNLHKTKDPDTVIADTYRYGEITHLPEPSRPGYTFAGWYSSPDYADGTKVNFIDSDASGDLDLYAHWIPAAEPKKSALPVRPGGHVQKAESATATSPSMQEYGRVYCGNYSAVLVPGSSQTIVDAPDSCAYFDYLGLLVLADHASQGFNNIKTNNTLTAFGRTYTCIARREGTNTGYGIQFDDETWFDTYAQEIGATMCAYTCNDVDGSNVTATFWK